ncbi:DUF6247 family protein [Streptomyces sp. MspMP-M5]|uniref:DUF6247 family protein n=1 Tax=unclassified Streptomyces TaxID=2593676 RepID=UPI00039F0464|nr:DUF6247 family protein [Streptomyces sp. MspMP-M5]
MRSPKKPRPAGPGRRRPTPRPAARRPPRRHLGAGSRAGLGRGLETSRDTYSLFPLHDVVRAWQLRRAAAPAVGAYLDSGRDETDFVDLDDILGARR